MPESRTAILRGIATLLRGGPKHAPGGVKSVAGHGDGKPRTHFASENLGTVKCWAGDFSERGWGRRRVLFTVLLGRTSGHRSAGALLRRSPHHPIGRTPAQSPSCGGALFRTVDRSCLYGCGSRLLPPLPKRAPTLSSRDPPAIEFLKPPCGFLWPEPWHNGPLSIGASFADELWKTRNTGAGKVCSGRN